MFDILKDNGYPRNFVSNVKENLQQRPQNLLSDQLNPRKKYISTPYIKGTSERVSRLMKPYNIQLSNKPTNTIRSQLCKLKDRRNVTEKTNVVYEISCRDCDQVYIGQTSRQLQQRVSEHQRAVRLQDHLSLLYQHSNQHTHTMNFENVKILASEKNDSSRVLLESFYSASKGNSAINRSQQFSELYIPTISQLI